MSKNEKRLFDFLSSHEQSSVAKLLELQSTQSFDGTLKIRTDRVYVDREHGKRALERLLKLRAADARVAE